MRTDYLLILAACFLGACNSQPLQEGKQKEGTESGREKAEASSPKPIQQGSSKSNSEAKSPDQDPEFAKRGAEVMGHLQFVEPGPKGANTKSVKISELISEIKIEEIDSYDHYYKKNKSYLAISLPQALMHLSGAASAQELKKAKFSFQASDGYVVKIKGEQAMNPEAFLAFADAEQEQFDPIGEQGVNPGPLYMVWRGKELSDEKLYPRPWALARIEIIDEHSANTHLKPSSGFAADSLAELGFELFEKDCVRCHSINQEGGKVGPDLNVPQNILAYRDEEQLKKFIKDPRSFRYSAMPPHPGLSDKELDALIAYFRVMGKNQHDPHAASMVAK